MATESKTERPSSTFDWVGPLSTIPLAEVVRRIANEERSGDLQVIFGQTIKTVYLDRGFVVLAAHLLQEAAVLVEQPAGRTDEAVVTADVDAEKLTVGPPGEIGRAHV